MVKLFEQFIQDNLSEKTGLSQTVKTEADNIVDLLKGVLSTEENYGDGFKSHELYMFKDQELKDTFGADGIDLIYTLDVGPTLFKRDVFSKANTYDSPRNTKIGKIVLINVEMSMDMDAFENHFSRGVESAMVELRSLLYHELTHSTEFSRRGKTGSPIQGSMQLVKLRGSQDMQNQLTGGGVRDVPFFITRFFQLMYYSTSYEINAWAAMIVADMDRHKFKDRKDYDTVKDFLKSNHDTLEARSAELMQTNSWRVYLRMKEFSMATFLKELQEWGLPFEKFFIALSMSNNRMSDIVKKTIQGDPNIENKDRPAILKSVDDTIALLKKEGTNKDEIDPIDRMRAVAKRISDAKDKLHRKLLRMVTYE